MEKQRSIILPREFFLGDTTKIARGLLGKRLVRIWRGARLSGVIVETEAYLGLKDPACHSYHGKRTPRVEPMYQPGGYSYVYMIYGMHYCFNIVTGDETRPEAVLIRAIEPDPDCLVTLRKFRKVEPDENLTNGPGKLCDALKIDRKLNGLDMSAREDISKTPELGSPIWIEEASGEPLSPQARSRKIKSSPRIGIESKGHAAKWPLRFYLASSKYISRL